MAAASIENFALVNGVMKQARNIASDDVFQLRHGGGEVLRRGGSSSPGRKSHTFLIGVLNRSDSGRDSG